MGRLLHQVRVGSSSPWLDTSWPSLNSTETTSSGEGGSSSSSWLDPSWPSLNSTETTSSGEGGFINTMVGSFMALPEQYRDYFIRWGWVHQHHGRILHGPP